MTEKDIEIWKDIPNYEGIYQASNFGRIKRLSSKFFVIDKKQKRSYYKTINEKILKQFYDNNGYLVFNLLGKRTRTHRIIAKTFIPNPKNKLFINHKDGNKSNSNVENLEWCSAKENTQHAIATGLQDVSHLLNYIEKQKVLMLSKNDEVIAKFNSITEAFKFFGVKYRGCITEVCQGKRKHCFGYKWRYDE